MPTKAATTDEENATTFVMSHDGVQINMRATTAEHRTPTIGEIEACLRAALERGGGGEMRQAPQTQAANPQSNGPTAGHSGGTGGTGGNQPTGGGNQRSGSNLTPAGRKKLRDAMKARWAKQRAAAAAKGTAKAGGAGTRRPHRAVAAATT